TSSSTSLKGSAYTLPDANSHSATQRSIPFRTGPRLERVFATGNFLSDGTLPFAFADNGTEPNARPEPAFSIKDRRLNVFTLCSFCDSPRDQQDRRWSRLCRTCALLPPARLVNGRLRNP